MQRGKYPYRDLGDRLQAFRKKLNESIMEVSGAVELDSESIKLFELGEKRPSEDVLDLLISHFDINEEEADELWDLAGYTDPVAPQNALPQVQAMMLMLPMDNKIIYTDKVDLSINKHGVVMSFFQEGQAGQAVSISKVGMSLEHAKSVLEVLGKTIDRAEMASKPKQLPSRTPRANKKPKNSSE